MKQWLFLPLALRILLTALGKTSQSAAGWCPPLAPAEAPASPAVQQHLPTPNLIKEIHFSKKQYYCSEGILKPFNYPSSSTSAELDLNPYFSQFTPKALSSIQEIHPFSRSQCQSFRYPETHSDHLWTDSLWCTFWPQPLYWQQTFSFLICQTQTTALTWDCIMTGMAAGAGKAQVA